MIAARPRISNTFFRPALRGDHERARPARQIRLERKLRARKSCERQLAYSAILTRPKFKND